MAAVEHARDRADADPGPGRNVGDGCHAVTRSFTGVVERQWKPSRAFHAVTIEVRIPRGEPAAEQPALTGTSPWADRDEPEVEVERGGPLVRRGDAEVDAWHAGEGIEQRLQQAATDSAPLRSWEQVHVEVGRELDQHLGRRARRVVDEAVELLVGGQPTIVGRIGVAGAQRRPPSRLTRRLERGRVVGTDDVAVDAGVPVGDERQVRAQHAGTAPTQTSPNRSRSPYWPDASPPASPVRRHTS